MKILKEIKHLYYWLFIAKGSGLKPTPVDFRDYNTGIFRWFGYTPKKTRHIIQTMSIKDQIPFNTCQWNATIVQKEPDEKCRLSVRQMVSKGKRMGMIEGDGFSNLRDGQKVLNEWGAVEEGEISEGKGLTWAGYSGVNSDLYKDRASKHKTGSFWSVSSRNDVLKLLDDGRIIATGMKWFTGFNQGGGFKEPWLITKPVGYLVGGHAVVIIGYDLNYQGRKVYIMQNSYGSAWGDNGKFYVDMDYLDNNNYGYFVNLDDVDKELGNFVMQYDGKNVKGRESSGIFHIQAGKKKPYPNWETFLSWDGKRRGFTEVDKAVLDRVPVGDMMDITKSDYWMFLKDVKEANRLDALMELIYKDN